MERSNPFSKLFSIILPIFDQIYIFQLEEYKIGRYLKRTPKFFFRRNLQKRGKLVPTQYVKRLFVVISIVNFLSFLPFTGNVSMIIFLSILPMLVPQLFVIVGSLTLKPYYLYISARNKEKAKIKVSTNRGLKVIGITGSYGKTTTKSLLNQLINESFITQMVPGNINTDIGIANWINKNLNDSTEILIVEMGAYVIGEIRNICKIVPPDIAVITAIGDQHLERFGSIENLAQAKQEIFVYSNPKSLKFAPTDLKSLISAPDVTFVDTFPERYTNLPASEGLNHNLNIAIAIANELEVSENFINHSLQNLTLPERRGNTIDLVGFETIDNSYNISLHTAKTSVEALLNNKKKLLVITAGIPEVGSNKEKFNEEYGEFLNQKADKVILLRSDLAKYISPTLSADKVIATDTFKEALTRLQEDFSPKEYIVLLQPEFNDLYY